MKKILIISLILIYGAGVSLAQVNGVVKGINSNGDTILLPNANIYWTSISNGTTSNLDGSFSIDQPSEGVSIVVSYIGYHNDTISAPFSSQPYIIIMKENSFLNEVEISSTGAGSHIDRMNPIYTENITDGELKRAACCNLAESFETNASVDVNYTDAVSGAKQIQLLGLAGVYSQLLIENIPFMRGIGASFGMEYIPGTWLESIQVSKGPANIRNGFESITGQINAELKKPGSEEKFFFNYLINDKNRVEFNFNSSQKVSKKVSSIVLGHYSFLNDYHDNNNDGFADLPTGNRLVLGNFWQFNGTNGLEMRWGGRYINETRKGGQIEGSPNVTEQPQGLWLSNIKNERYEVYAKAGKVFNDPKSSSIGFINSFSMHDMSVLAGQKLYTGSQTSFYSNLIFDSKFKNFKHSYNTGISFMYDDVQESLNDTAWNSKQTVPGVFFQYIYTQPEKLTFMSGIRADYNSEFGLLITPRIHVKWFANEHTSIRVSAGMGHRVAYLLPENLNLLSSSRRIIFPDENKMETAINGGISLVKHFDILGREMTVSLEYYYTRFLNQILFDMESDTAAIHIFNLDGESYSNAAQAEVSYSLNKWIDVRAAIRYTDVRYTFPDGVLRKKPLLSEYKGFLTVGYTSNMNKWKADATMHLNGRTRLPDRSAFPTEYQLNEFSPSFSVVNLQLTRNYRHWSIYAGVENLFGFTQKDPIISAENPYSPYFDSGIIWGPISGRKLYAGVRVFFNRKK